MQRNRVSEWDSDGIPKTYAINNVAINFKLVIFERR